MEQTVYYTILKYPLKHRLLKKLQLSDNARLIIHAVKKKVKSKKRIFLIYIPSPLYFSSIFSFSLIFSCFILCFLGITAQRWHVRNADTFFVRLHRIFESILSYGEKVMCNMTENLQVYDVLCAVLPLLFSGVNIFFCNWHNKYILFREILHKSHRKTNSSEVE